MLKINPWFSFLISKIIIKQINKTQDLWGIFCTRIKREYKNNKMIVHVI